MTLSALMYWSAAAFLAVDCRAEVQKTMGRGESATLGLSFLCCCLRRECRSGIGIGGGFLGCSIHDLLRDLCIMKANEEKFLRVKNSPEVMFSKKRRVSVQSSYGKASPELMSGVRSFICSEDKIIFPVLSLVKVLHIMDLVFEKFPQELLQLVNLRYLAFSCTSGLPIGISRLSNLQTLISPQLIYSVPSEMWELPELRHLRLFTVIEIEEGCKMKFVHKKLQTLSDVWVTPSLIRSGFFETIPNIIKLGIFYKDSPDIEVDLRHLHKLETLRCQSELDKDGSRFLNNLRFPCNLRKLTLINCVIFRSLLTSLCALPNLEVLKIGECVFERNGEEEEEWEVREGDEFRSLQFLCLQSLNICMECYKLEEIPSAIEDIPTLQEIVIIECSTSVARRVRQIQKEQQEEYDNYGLRVDITD